MRIGIYARAGNERIEALLGFGQLASTVGEGFVNVLRNPHDFKDQDFEPFGAVLVLPSCEADEEIVDFYKSRGVRAYDVTAVDDDALAHGLPLVEDDLDAEAETPLVEDVPPEEPEEAEDQGFVKVPEDAPDPAEDATPPAMENPVEPAAPVEKKGRGGKNKGRKK